MKEEPIMSNDTPIAVDLAKSVLRDRRLTAIGTLVANGADPAPPRRNQRPPPLAPGCSARHHDHEELIFAPRLSLSHNTTVGKIFPGVAGYSASTCSLVALSAMPWSRSSSFVS